MLEILIGFGTFLLIELVIVALILGLLIVVNTFAQLLQAASHQHMFQALLDHIHLFQLNHRPHVGD